MQITKTAIKRGVTFLMIYIVAVGFGLFSLMRLRMDLFPRLDFPIIAVITQYTGVGPFDIETVVTRPIEETVAAVQNVKTVSSTSRQGLSLTLLEFEWGSDMDQAEIDVRNNLDFIEDYLPDDISDPLVFAFDPSMQPIAFLAVGSQFHGLAELRRISERELEPQIERIPGVASATTSGGLQREIKILVDPVRLRAHHISIQQIETALRMNNLQLPSGWINNDQQEFTIQTQGEYRNIEEIENTNVAIMGESVIRIKDVADVVDGFVEQRQRVLVNNNPSVLLIIQKQSDANTVRNLTGIEWTLTTNNLRTAQGGDPGDNIRSVSFYQPFHVQSWKYGDTGYRTGILSTPLFSPEFPQFGHCGHFNTYFHYCYFFSYGSGRSDIKYHFHGRIGTGRGPAGR